MPATPEIHGGRKQELSQSDALIDLFEQSDSDCELTDVYYEVPPRNNKDSTALGLSP